MKIPRVFLALVCTLIATAAHAQKKPDVGDFPFWTGKGGYPTGPYVPGLNAALLLTDEQKIKITDARQETIGSSAVGEAGRKLKTTPNLTDAERDDLRKVLDDARDALREKVRGILTTEQKEFIERATMLHGQASVEVSEQFASRFAGAKGNKEDYAAAQKEFQARLREEYLRKLDTIMSPEQKTALRERAELEAKREAEAANAPKKKGNN